MRSSSKRCRVFGCQLSEASTAVSQFTLGMGGESPMAVGNMVYETDERGISFFADTRVPMAVANYIEGNGSKVVDGTTNAETGLLASNVLYRNGSGDMIENADARTMIHGNPMANTSRNQIDFGADERGVWSNNICDTTDADFIAQDRGVRAESINTLLEPAEYGMTITNTGATRIVTHTLPPAQPGGLDHFLRDSAGHNFRVDPNGTEVIGTGGAGKYLELQSDKAWVRVRCIIAGRWEVSVHAATTGFEP